MALAIKKPRYVTRVTRPMMGGNPVTVTMLVREPPIIYPYDDAVAHNSMKGDQFEGVLKGGAYQGLGYRISGSSFYLGAGFGSIYGREFEVETEQEIDLGSLTGYKYVIVYLEINLKSVVKQSISLKYAYAGAGYPDIDSDDLIKKKNGIGRMMLYTFIYDASASPKISSINSKIYQYSDGVAEEVRRLTGDKLLNGRQISNLHHATTDRWKNAMRATSAAGGCADLAKSIGTSGEWVAASDQLEIKSTNESYNRQIVKITKGKFLVSIDKKSNQTLNFYYSDSDFKNPIPRGAKVIGIIVGGKHSASGYGKHCYFTPQHEVHETKIFGWVTGKGHWMADEGQYMYDGRIYEDQLELQMKALLYQADHIIGVETDWVGSVLMDPRDPCKVDCGNSKITDYSYGLRTKLATFKFMAVRTIPYIQVTIPKGITVSCELAFRLLYIQGEERLGKEGVGYDNWDTQHQFPYTTYTAYPDENPFSQLNPQLEGGQT